MMCFMASLCFFSLARPESLWESLKLCIGYAVPSWGHLSLANVGRSWAAGFVALWHSYLLSISATLIFMNCAVCILRSYIQWFSVASPCLDSLQDPEVKRIITVHFFGAFFRSYIVMMVTGDLLRFSYLLCKDAWRPDSFEAYRRLFVGDGLREVDAGEPHFCSWSSLSKRQKLSDVIWQCLIHISLDLIPLTFFFLSFFLDSKEVVTFCSACLSIGVFHIIFFYVLFEITEIYLKVSDFQKAWAMARGARSQVRLAHKRMERCGSAQRSIYVCCGAFFLRLFKAFHLLENIFRRSFQRLYIFSCYFLNFCSIDCDGFKMLGFRGRAHRLGIEFCATG